MKSILLALPIAFVISANAKDPIKSKIANCLTPSKDRANTQQNAAQSTALKPLEAIRYLWDGSSNEWIFNDTIHYAYNNVGDIVEEHYISNYGQSKTTYSYNPQGKLVERSNMYLDMGNWRVMSKEVYDYDAQGNEILSERYYFNFSTNSLVKYYGSKNIRAYDSNNRLVSNEHQMWFTHLQAYRSDSKEILTYNGSVLGNLVYQIFDTISSTFVNERKSIYLYNSSDVLITYIEQKWDGTTWVDTLKVDSIVWHVWDGLDSPNSDVDSYTMYIFNSGNWEPDSRYRVISRGAYGSYSAVEEDFNVGTSAWEYVSRETVTRDQYGSSVTLKEDYDTNTNSWRNVSRVTHNYDAFYEVVLLKSEIWNTSTNSWDIQYYNEFDLTYDGNKITEKVIKYYNPQLGALVNGERYVYTQHSTFTAIQDAGFLSVEAYPNPTKGDVIVKNCNNATAEVYNIAGELLTKIQVGPNNRQVDLSNYSSGIYFVKLVSESGEVKNMKIIKE